MYVINKENIVHSNNNPPPVELNRKAYSKTDTYTNPGGVMMQNRQFNTPIGMYSTDAITDTLETVHISGASSNHSSESEAPKMPVYKNSEVLQMVKELDDEKKGPPHGGPGRHSDRTGRTQVGAPWTKTKSGARSPYNIYNQADTDEAQSPEDITKRSEVQSQLTARQAIVAGSARPAGASTGMAQPATAATGMTRPTLAGSRAPAVGVHSPMGYKSVTPKTTPAQSPTPVGQLSNVGQGQSLSAPEGQGMQTMTNQAAATLEAPVSGFRSVSPVFSSDARLSCPPPSVLDKNFNIKPRPFGFSHAQPSHVEPPVPTHQRVSPVHTTPTQQSVPEVAPPAVTGTGPGYGGPKIFTPPIWSERVVTPESNASYPGTEAHGTDATDDSYDLHPNNPSDQNNQQQEVPPGTGPIRKKYSDEPIVSHVPAQSRSFQTLQGIVDPDHQEPYAGSAGLPPPRSASMERWREEQEAKRKGGPRVKVFMPQQYNCPIGMYSAGNVIDTFQTQAEVRMQDMERPQQKTMSDAQRAVLEEDASRPRY